MSGLLKRAQTLLKEIIDSERVYEFCIRFNENELIEDTHENTIKIVLNCYEKNIK